MTITEWIQMFIGQIAQTDWIQWAALAFGVVEVLFALADRIWLYPTGIIGTLLTIYLLVQAHLFADSVLNIYYVVMSVYGWWHWTRKKDLPPVKASFSNRREWMITAWITVGGTFLGYVILKNWTSSNVPFWDAWVSATGWAGMWLLARRKIENWILLNVSNAFAIPLLLYKQLPMLAVLTLILFIVAVRGYFSWRREIRGRAGKNALHRN